MECRFTVDIEKGEDGWLIAQCREIPEAMTQGKTIEEVQKNITEVIELILEERRSKASDSPIKTIKVAV
nr:type II toxin-antitoxin system HicB family antitoxin [Candidatus Njordarchaeum guaymaensis]